MSKFDLSSFRTPPKSARPMARWWWPGVDVTKEELLREVADMDEANFAGGEVQAFTDGIPPERKADPEALKKLHRYRTPYYFDVITALLEEMEKRGMTLDLTTCSGWPDNGTEVPLSQGQKHLYMASVTVEGGGARTVKLPTVDDLLAYRADEKAKSPAPPRRGPFGAAPDDTEVLRQNLRLVGVSAARCVGDPVDVVMTHATEKTGQLEKPVDLWARVQDGCVTWDFPEGTWQVFAYFAGPNGNSSHMAAKEDPDKPAIIVDHFGKDIVYPYLDRHIGKGGWGKYAGKTLRAFFTDSFELSSPWTWTDDFFAEFEKRRGYDLRPYLMVTSVPGNDSMFAKMMGLKTPPMYDLPDGLGERVRYDYQLTIADIFDDYFLGELKRWGDDNDMKSRVQCYGHSMDNLKAFGRTHIPETEQLAANGVVDFMKLVGSASMLYQLPLATSETLVWIGHDYMTTPTKMKVAADKLFVSGVNQIIYHGMPYRHPELPFPHFYPFHGMFGSFMCRDNTLWPAIGAMNLRIARAQALMQAGPIQADVAVYYQKLDYVAGSEAMEELTGGVLPGFDRNGTPNNGHAGEMGRETTADQARSNSDFRLSHILMGAGYDYFFLNEECLLRAELIDGCLVCGDARYRALVLNEETHITIEAAYKLAELMSAGFPVIFLGCVPDKVPGLRDYEAQETELRRLMSGSEPVAQGDAPKALAECGVLPTLVSGCDKLQHIRRDLDGQTLWFVRSSAPEAFSLPVRLEGAGGGLRILDPATGEVVKPAYTNEENGLCLELPFAPYGSWFILTGDEAELPAPTGDAALVIAQADCRADGVEIVPEGGWRLSGKNAVAGGADIDCTRAALGDWADDEALKSFSGTAVYEAAFTLADIPAGRVVLDLGKVGDTAHVTLNGCDLGCALAAPFAFDVTGKLVSGENTLRIEVTNTLRNGLVGVGAFAGGPAIGGPGPRELSMSGIVGPVRLVAGI